MKDQKISKKVKVKQEDPRDPQNHSLWLKAHKYKNWGIQKHLVLSPVFWDFSNLWVVTSHNYNCILPCQWELCRIVVKWPQSFGCCCHWICFVCIGQLNYCCVCIQSWQLLHLLWQQHQPTCFILIVNEWKLVFYLDCNIYIKSITCLHPNI